MVKREAGRKITCGYHKHRNCKWTRKVLNKKKTGKKNHLDYLGNNERAKKLKRKASYISKWLNVYLIQYFIWTMPNFSYSAIEDIIPRNGPREKIERKRTPKIKCESTITNYTRTRFVPAEISSAHCCSHAINFTTGLDLTLSYCAIYCGYREIQMNSAFFSYIVSSRTQWKLSFTLCATLYSCHQHYATTNTISDQEVFLFLFLIAFNYFRICWAIKCVHSLRYISIVFHCIYPQLPILFTLAKAARRQLFSIVFLLALYFLLTA